MDGSLRDQATFSLALERDATLRAGQNFAFGSAKFYQQGIDFLFAEFSRAHVRQHRAAATTRLLSYHGRANKDGFPRESHTI